METHRPEGSLEISRPVWPIAVLVFGLTSLAFYWPNLNGWFLIDDVPLIHLGRIVAADNPWILLAPDVGIYWRPVVKLVIALEAYFFGLTPLGYHIMSLIYHAIAGTLVYLLALRLTRSRSASWLAGLIFAMHPIHYFTVNWISARYDLFCTVFVLAALIWLCKYLEKKKPTQLVWFLVFQLLAVFSKELAFVLPVLAFLIVIACGTGNLTDRLKRSGLALPASLALLLIVLAVRFFLLEGLGGPELFALRGPLVAVGYLLLLLPYVMFSPLISPASADPLILRLLVLGLLTALALLTVVWLLSGNRTRRLMPWAMALAACLPFAGMIKVTWELEASYLLYLPSAFFCMGLGWLLLPRSDKLSGPIRMVGLSAAVLFLLIFAPMLMHNNRAMAQATQVAEKIDHEVVRILGNEPRLQTVFFWNFPRRIHGIYLYFDDLGLNFLHRYDRTRLSLVTLGDKLYSDQGNDQPRRLIYCASESENPTADEIDISELTLPSGNRIMELPAELRIDLKEAKAFPGELNRYPIVEVVRWIESSGQPDTECHIRWEGQTVEDRAIAEDLLVDETADCRVILVGDDPRWTATVKMESLRITTGDRQAEELLFRSGGIID